MAAVEDGIVRENYARAGEPGVVIVFELDSVEEARRYTDDFPLTKAGFLEWRFIPLMIPLPIESLFRGEVDGALVARPGREAGELGERARFAENQESHPALPLIVGADLKQPRDSHSSAAAGRTGAVG